MKIINKVEVTKSPTIVNILGISSPICIFTGAIMLIPGFKFGTVILNIEPIYAERIAIGIIVIGVLFFITAAKIDHPVPTGRYRYEVLLEDSDSLLDIQCKYRVIEKYEKRWIIEDIDEQ